MWITKLSNIGEGRIDMECNYQRLYDKMKLIVKEDTYMIFHDEMKPLYLETDASGV